MLPEMQSQVERHLAASDVTADEKADDLTSDLTQRILRSLNSEDFNIYSTGKLV